MPTGLVYLAMSLDGFIAREDGSVDWLNEASANAEGEDLGIEAFWSSIDVMVMGRGSFETLMKIDVWPYPFPVVVLSRSMTDGDIPEKLGGKVRLSALAPGPVMEELAAEGHERVYVDGGQLVQSFLAEGLVSELTLTIIPVLLGSGLRCFPALEKDMDLKLLGSKSFASGLVQSTYGVT